MVKFKKATAILFMICLLSSMCCLTVLAEGGDLPDSFFIDDENGVSVTGDGAYFLYMDDIMPGDVVTRTLTLRNLEQGDPFAVYMLSEVIGTDGPVDWLDNLHMSITLDGREIYSGRVRGDGMDTRTMKGNGADLLYDGLDLGEFKQGDYGILRFVITADGGHLSAEDYKVSSEAKTRFLFNAVNTAGKGGTPPKTGENVKYGLYFLLLLLMILCLILRYRLMVFRREGDACQNAKNSPENFLR
jgi:hypothetical protein